MKPVEVSASAERDLCGIYDTVLLDNGYFVAERVYGRIEEAMEAIGRYPRGFTAREDLPAGVRRVAVYHYLILYKERESDVLILRVVHGSMDIEHVILDSE